MQVSLQTLLWNVRARCSNVTSVTLNAAVTLCELIEMEHGLAECSEFWNSFHLKSSEITRWT